MFEKARTIISKMIARLGKRSTPFVTRHEGGLAGEELFSGEAVYLGADGRYYRV